MYLLLALQPQLSEFGRLIHEVSSSHTTTHHSPQDSSGRVISSSQRPLPDNTQHSQQTNFHVPVGLRTHDLDRRAAADLRLRPRGRWDQFCNLLLIFISPPSPPTPQPAPPSLYVLPLILWSWKWTFKQQHLIYVKREYFTNQKVNVMKYTTFCRGIN